MFDKLIDVGISVLFSIIVGAYVFGKLEQKLIDGQKASSDRLDAHELWLKEIAAEAVQHERADNSHFRDNDAHWNRREREQLNGAIEEISANVKTLLVRTAKLND